MTKFDKAKPRCQKLYKICNIKIDLHSESILMAVYFVMAAMPFLCRDPFFTKIIRAGTVDWGVAALILLVGLARGGSGVFRTLYLGA